MSSTNSSGRRASLGVRWTFFALLFPALGRGVEFDGLPKDAGLPKGICVHIGGTVSGTIALSQAGKNLVHRLDYDALRVEEARRELAAKGLYGPISVEHWTSACLPYVDNLVNLIVADDPTRVPEDELLRVLCPKGAAFLKAGAQYRKISKPWPNGIGEWTHQWKDPAGALASEDKQGVPANFRWIAGPTFSAGGRKISTTGTVVAGGRIFYITNNDISNLAIKDLSEQSIPYYLIARDAFNGHLLWKRKWSGPLWGYIANRPTGSPVLVAVDEKLFMAEEGVPLSLNAASGTEGQRYPCEGKLQALLVKDQSLLVETSAGHFCFDAGTARLKWKRDAKNLFSTVIADDIYFLCLEKDKIPTVTRLDLGTGKERWTVAPSAFSALNGHPVKICGASEKTVAFVGTRWGDKRGTGVVTALSSEDGRVLWTKETPAIQGKEYVDPRTAGHFYRKGLFWMRTDITVWQGLDPISGVVKQEIRFKNERESWPPSADRGKMGCQPIFATERFLVASRQATFIDLETGNRHFWSFARGGCGVGAIPAHGLLYLQPHACACFQGVTRGLLALDDSAVGTPAPPDQRLQRGAAFGVGRAGEDAKNGTSGPASHEARSDEWPTYRQNGERGAASSSPVGASLQKAWEANIADARPSFVDEEWQLRVGNPITAPVVAEGKVFVGYPNAHRLIVLDAATGKEAWRFTAGGRIDSPPTIHRGLALLGCHDGSIYCLRVLDGKPVWKFLAATRDRRMTAFGQYESLWPVAGSVLVQNGRIFAAAGRTPQASGGIQLYCLDPETGKVEWSKNLGAGITGTGDLLSGDGQAVFYLGRSVDSKTGDVKDAGPGAYFQPWANGYLEASWKVIPLALRKDLQTCRFSKEYSGQMIAFSKDGVFRCEPEKQAEGTAPRSYNLYWAAKSGKSWTGKIETFQVEALALSANSGLLAGASNPRDRKAGGTISHLSLLDGSRIGVIPLASPPVWDGLAVARGKVFVSTEDGKIHCFAGK